MLLDFMSRRRYYRRYASVGQIESPHEVLLSIRRRVLSESLSESLTHGSPKKVCQKNLSTVACKYHLVKAFIYNFRVFLWCYSLVNYNLNFSFLNITFSFYFFLLYVNINVRLNKYNIELNKTNDMRATGRESWLVMLCFIG